MTPLYPRPLILRRVGASFAAAVFPFKCQGCGVLFRPSFFSDLSTGMAAERGDNASIRALFEAVFSRFLCPLCLGNFQPVNSPICTCCGLVFKSRQGEDHFCGECLAGPKHFETARAFGVYDGALMALIHQFKYYGKTGLGASLGRLLFSVYRRNFRGRAPDLIVPVPLHQRRFRKRGYNQAYLLVQGWDRLARAGEAHPAPERIDRRVLLRKRPTLPQTGLGRKQRLTNIKNAFAVEDAAAVDGRQILLVDDVLTTGATVNECARMLRVAGAAGVDVLTLARGM